MVLSDCRKGMMCRVVRVAGDGAVKRRIRDMGFTTGGVVEVLRIAPLGDPIEVRVKGFNLTLRKTEAADIEVSMDAAGEGR